jgi:hypothetical protein
MSPFSAISTEMKLTWLTSGALKASRQMEVPSDGRMASSVA